MAPPPRDLPQSAPQRHRVISGHTQPRVETTRGPRELASFGQRFGGSLMDALFLGALAGVIWIVYFADYPWDNRPLEVGAFLFWFGVLWMWNFVGWTPGMRAVEVIIITKDGEAPGLWRALARSVGAFISAAPLGLGFLWAAWAPSRRTWHDYLAGTYVVVDFRHQFNDTPIPDIEELRDRRLSMGRVRDV